MMDKLYERDYNFWLEQTTKAIKNRDLDNLDWNNLIVEIEDMGASQKRALRSYFFRLIEHILKLKYWKSEQERNKNHWLLEIKNFQTNIEAILEDSPSLKNYLAQNHQKWQSQVMKNVAKSGLFSVDKANILTLEEIFDL